MLSVLCNLDEEGWSHEAAAALVDSSVGQDDPDLLWSLATALGHASDPVGAPVLAGLTHHFDRRRWPWGCSTQRTPSGNSVITA
jgi:hypothetical protein